MCTLGIQHELGFLKLVFCVFELQKWMKPSVSTYLFIHKNFPILTAVSIADYKRRLMETSEGYVFLSAISVEPAPPTPKVQTPHFGQHWREFQKSLCRMSSKSCGQPPQLFLYKGTSPLSTYPSQRTHGCVCACGLSLWHFVIQPWQEIHKLEDSDGRDDSLLQCVWGAHVAVEKISVCCQSGK